MKLKEENELGKNNKFNLYSKATQNMFVPPAVYYESQSDDLEEESIENEIMKMQRKNLIGHSTIDKSALSIQKELSNKLNPKIIINAVGSEELNFDKSLKKTIKNSNSTINNNVNLKQEGTHTHIYIF